MHSALALLRLSESGFAGFRNLDVAFPAFVFQLDVLYQDRIRVRIQVCLSLKLRNPAAVHFVGNGKLTGLVANLDDDVLAEVLERHFGAEARSEIPDLIRPLLE